MSVQLTMHVKLSIAQLCDDTVSQQQLRQKHCDIYIYIYIYHTVTSHHIIPATTCSLQMLCHGSIGSFGQRNSNYVVFFFCRLYKNTALHFFQFIFSGCRPRLTTLLSGGAVANAVVDTYAERVLSVCQRVKSQLAGLVTDYHSYQESHQQLSQCQ